MKAVFLVGAVQALFLAILLFSKKNKITADYILAFWLIITGIPLFLYFINYDNYSLILNHSKSIPTYLMIINIPLLLIQSPFLFLYVNAVVKTDKKFKPVYLLNFIPAILFLIAFHFLIDFNSENKTAFNLYEYPYYRIILIFFPLTTILAFFYIVKSFLKIKKFRKKIQSQYSYTENIDFNWLKNLIIIIAAVWFILSVFALLFKNMHNIINIQDIILISVSIAIFILGYFGFLRTNIFLSARINENIGNSGKEKNGAVKPVIPENEAKQILEKLISFMQKEKPYLESKLTLKQLADKISVQPHRLSNIINEHLHKNFFDFINEYRVEEVKKQLSVNKNYTLLGIAYECGFNSKSSFNRIFRNFTGVTPSEYQKRTNSQP